MTIKGPIRLHEVIRDIIENFLEFFILNTFSIFRKMDFPFIDQALHFVERNRKALNLIDNGCGAALRQFAENPRRIGKVGLGDVVEEIEIRQVGQWSFLWTMFCPSASARMRKQGLRVCREGGEGAS